MLKYILPLIDDCRHRVYVEPFCGGAAVFFAKPRSEIEIINDTNKELINFYRILKNNFEELKKEIELTLYSRAQYNESHAIHKNSVGISDVHRAWAMWAVIRLSFGKAIRGWSNPCLVNNNNIIALNSHKKAFNKKFLHRIESTNIECIDAFKCIKKYDSPETLFYIDPPYIDSDQAYYDGWREENEIELLNLLENLKGKFIHSNYPNAILSKFVEKNKWSYREINCKPTTINNAPGHQTSKPKIETLTWNFKESQLTLFQHE